MKEKFTKLGFMLVVSMLFLLASCGTPEEKKMAFFAKGNSLFEAGDYVKARLEFKNAVQIDPKFAQGYYMLSKSALRLGEGKAAFGLLNKAIQLDPGLIEARLDLGRMFFSGRAFERAGQQADEILKIDPANVDARLLKAGVYLSEKKFKDAGDMLDMIDGAKIQMAGFYLLKASYFNATGKNNMAEDVLKKGMKEHPESLALIMELAKYHSQKGDLKSVETYLKKAHEISPETIGVKLNLARLYIETQRRDEALIILNRIIDSEPENEKNRMAVAVLLINSGDLDTGIEIVEKGIENTPASYAYSALLSEIYLKKKEIKKAEDVLHKFLSLEDQLPTPHMIKAKINLVNLLLIERRNSDAEVLIDQVLEDDPKNIDAHRLKGRMYLVSGDGPGAVSKFRAVTSENPEDIEGLIGLANAHALSGDYDLSLDVLSNALKTSPDSVAFLKERIRVNVMKKDPTAVEKDLKQIIRLEPDNPVSMASLGDFYLSLNRYEDALSQYEFIKNKNPDIPLGYLKTALVFARQNQVDKAIEELETGSKKSPQSSVFATSIAQLYLKQGKKQAAIEKFRDALDLDPKNIFAWLTLANIYELSNDYEKAMVVYRDFLGHHPDSWSAANNLAFLLTENGQSKASLEEAMTLAQKAVTLNPGSPLVLDTMGWIYYKKGELAKAEDKISQAIEKMPDNDVISYHLGVICHDLGKRLEAEVNLKKALASNNEFLGRQHAVVLYERYYK